PGKLSPDYYATDLLSDILGRGKSSRLYEKLVKEKKLFNSIHAHVSGTIDPALLIIDGKLNEGVSIEDGEQAINEVVGELAGSEVSERELSKVKNQAEASIVFENVEVINRATNLAFAAVMGDPELINK